MIINIKRRMLILCSFTEFDLSFTLWKLALRLKKKKLSMGKTCNNISQDKSQVLLHFSCLTYLSKLVLVNALLFVKIEMIIFTTSYLNFALPHCYRICAIAFKCSVSVKDTPKALECWAASRTQPSSSANFPQTITWVSSNTNSFVLH